MATVFLVINDEGECLAVFSTRALAETWLEAHVLADIASGYYGRRSLESATLSWQDSKVGFVRSSFGREPTWLAVSEEILEVTLDPPLGQEI